MRRGSFLNLLVLVGFVSLELGIVAQWSGAVAAIVAGLLLMVMGSLPYWSPTMRKRS